MVTFKELLASSVRSIAALLDLKLFSSRPLHVTIRAYLQGERVALANGLPSHISNFVIRRVRFTRQPWLPDRRVTLSAC